MGIHLLRCGHGNERARTHDAICDTFAAITRDVSFHMMLVSMWDENNYMHFLQPHSTPFVDESTLCSPKMTFAPWPMLSLPTHHKWIYFPNLAQLKDLLHYIQIKPRKGANVTDTPLINSSF
jgi:hypothetical protein